MKFWTATIALAAAFACNGMSHAAQCRSGDMEVDITAHWIEDLDGSDEFPCGSPELYLKIFVEDLLLCERGNDGSDSRFEQSHTCTTAVPEPYAPFKVRIEVWEDDSGGVCAPDDFLDASPIAGRSVEFEYDPRCGQIRSLQPGGIPGCDGTFGSLADTCSGEDVTLRGNGDGDDVKLNFSVVPTDGRSGEDADLNFSNIQLIQVTPNPSSVVHQKATAVRLDVGNNYDTELSADVRVRITDKRGTVFEDIHPVTIPGCSTAEKNIFFLGGVFPEDGPSNSDLQLEVVVDPDLVVDCQDVPCDESDCRRINNTYRREKPMQTSKDLRVLFQPLPATNLTCAPHAGNAPSASATAAAAEPLAEELFPIAKATFRSTSERFYWPPGTPDFIGFLPGFCPHLKLANLDLMYRLATVDGFPAQRVVGVSNEGYFFCEYRTPCGSAVGASAGEFGRHGVILESEQFNVNGELVLHELGHTYDLSEAPCPLSFPESLWGCEDEYRWAANTLGLPTQGYRISTDEDKDGGNCIMGSTPAGTTLQHWIEPGDYERLLRWLPTTVSVDAIFMRMHLQIPRLGSFYRDDVTQASLIPDFALAGQGGLTRGLGTTTLDFRDGSGALIDSADFSPENITEDGMMGFTAADVDGSADEADVAVVVPLPFGTASIDLVRRDGTGESLVDTLLLAVSPISVTLVAPTIPVPVIPGDRLLIRWMVEDGSSFAGGQGMASGHMSFVYVSPDNGKTWIPIAGRLPGTEYEWEVQSSGRYMVRVFTTNGQGASEAAGAVDTDFDGCPDIIDQLPDIPQPDDDGDGIAEECDNCPGLPNRFQLDPDSDGHGSACDNCPETTNVDQSDVDGDARGDVCDCNPQDMDHWDSPQQITGLGVQNETDTKVTVTWDDQGLLVGPGVRYDLVTGPLDSIASGFSGAACAADDVATNGVSVIQVPLSPGEGYYYLVRAVNICDVGAYDVDSPSQQVPRGTIDSQPNACSP